MNPARLNPPPWSFAAFNHCQYLARSSSVHPSLTIRKSETYRNAALRSGARSRAAIATGTVFGRFSAPPSSSAIHCAGESIEVDCDARASPRLAMRKTLGNEASSRCLATAISAIRIPRIASLSPIAVVGSFSMQFAAILQADFASSIPPTRTSASEPASFARIESTFIISPRQESIG